MEFGPINNRLDHVIGVWNNVTVVWGGIKRGDGNGRWKFCDPETVYCHLDGIWMKKITSGEVPPPTAGSVAGIIGDDMYVACGRTGLLDVSITFDMMQNSDTIYKLDLNEWMWTKLEPGGTKPLKSCGMASWVTGERLFLFGGSGDDKEGGEIYPTSLTTHSLQNDDRDRVINNQLVFYDSVTNHWHWPTSHGNIPSPRVGLAAFVLDDPATDSTTENHLGSYAIVFGGCGQGKCLNDLFLLNLDNMSWQAVPVTGLTGLTLFGLWPETRMYHSLTKITSKSAVLFGGIDRSIEILGHSWLLNIEAAVSQSNPDRIWIRCEHDENLGRAYHSAIKEPSSGRLWIVGGYDETYMKPSDHIRELTFSSIATLKVLGVESVARCEEKFQDGIKELPKDLQNAIRTKAENHRVTQYRVRPQNSYGKWRETKQQLS